MPLDGTGMKPFGQGPEACTCDNLPKITEVIVRSHRRRASLGAAVIYFVCPLCERKTSRLISSKVTVSGPPEPDGGDA